MKDCYMRIISYICMQIFLMMRIGYDGKRAVQNFTGLGNYSRYVVEALSTFAPDNEYWLYAPVYKENRQLSSMLEGGRGVISVHHPSSWLWKRMSSLWRIEGIAGDLKRDKIALFHGLSNELPLRIHKVQNLKSVVTIHDLIFLQLPYCYPPVDRKIYDYKSRYACRHADHIIAVSECTKRDIIRFYGIPAEKISVIYQGCDSVFARKVSLEKQEEVRRRYQLPERYLLSVGSIEERKNTLVALQALAHLPDELHLVLVGKHTPYTDKLITYAEQANLKHRLHICHGIPFADLPVIYQRAETFIYPSIYEGFGIPILEALNSSLPVVAATGSCLEEAGGPDSLYVDPRDAEAMAAAVRKTQLPDVRQRMVEKGHDWAARFSLKQMADQTMDCYRKVLHL